MFFCLKNIPYSFFPSIFFIFFTSSQAFALEQFAAYLLCQNESGHTDCQEILDRVNDVSPVVVDGRVLPNDAARNRNAEQRVLMRQGNYLTEGGVVAELESMESKPFLPSRGLLVSDDSIPSDFYLEQHGPVIITIPERSFQSK